MWLTPSWIAIGAYILLSVFAFIFYELVGDVSAGVSALVHTDRGSLVRGAGILLIAALTMMVGRKLGISLVGHMRFGPNHRTAGRSAVWKDGRTIAVLAVAVGVMLVTVLAIGVGWKQLLWSSSYLTTADDKARTVASVLTPVSAVMFGLASVRARGLGAIIVYIATVLVAVSLFAIASRSLAVYIVLFVIARYLSVPKESREIFTVLFGFATSGLLIWLVLLLRGLPEHGLIPYTEFVFDTVLSLQPTNFLEGEQAWVFVLNNVFFSVPLTDSIASQEATLPLEYFLTAINPLPGPLTNWGEIFERLRVNSYTPYNMLGELWRYGISVFLGWYFVVGLMLGVLDYAVKDLLERGKTGIAMVILGLASLFVITSLQYNVRNTMRYLYYAMAVALGYSLLADTLTLLCANFRKFRVSEDCKG